MKTYTPEELKKLSDQELLTLHQKLHSLYYTLIREEKYTIEGTNREDIANQHVSVVDEITSRKLKHPPSTAEDDNLDKISERLTKIEDAISYNVLKPNDEQLRDDWRIVCAWYASIKQGKEFKYTETQVISLAVKIMKEIVRRKIAQFTPEKMTKWARELFDRVQTTLNRSNIKIPIKKYETIILGDVKLEFLGTKGLIEELPPGHKKHSVLRITFGGKKLLIDFGEDWLNKIKEVEHDAILITHAHPDHINGLEGYQDPVYAPKRTIKSAPSKLENLHFKIVPLEEKFNIKEVPGLSVKGIPCVHSILCPMTGYLINVGGYNIGYFSDVLHIKNYENVLKDLDLYIGDAATPKKDLVRRDKESDEPYGHASMQRQLGWCEKAGVKNVVFTHFGKWAEETKEKDFEFTGKFVFAKDGDSKLLSKCEDTACKLSEITKFVMEFKKAFIKPNKPAKRIYKPDDAKDLGFKQVLVQKKFDGARIQVIKTDKDIQFRTEDQGLDKTNRLPLHKEQFATLFKNLKETNLDGEAIMTEGKTPLHRTQVTGYLNGKGSTEPSRNLRIQIFDIMKYNGEDLTDKPLKERLEYLDKFKNTTHIIFCGSDEGKIVPLNQAPKLIKEFSKKPFSEGSMIKDMESKYRTDSIHNHGWVKIKKQLEIDCIVLDAIKNKTGYYNYLCGIGPITNEHAEAIKTKAQKFKNVYFAVLGKTFTEKETKAKKGDIIRVGVSEIKKKKVDNYYSYNFQDPDVLEKVSERKSPDDIAVADKLAEQTKPEISKLDDEEGEPTRSEVSADKWKNNWYKAFPKSGSGKFVYQRHWRGLTEEESKLSEESLFKTKHSVHGDLRLSASDAWGDLWGVTIFLGETKDAKDRLPKLPDNDSLQVTFKLPQPEGWLNIANTPYIVEPGGPGSTTETYAKFFEIDDGTYKIGSWREHFFEIFLKGSKLKGRFIIQYAPMGEEDRRVWLIKQPDNQTPYSESHDKDKVISELRSKKQKYLVWTTDGKPELIDVKGIKEKCDLCNGPLTQETGRWVPLLPSGKEIFIHKFGCPTEINPKVIKELADSFIPQLFVDLMTLAKGDTNDSQTEV